MRFATSFKRSIPAWLALAFLFASSLGVAQQVVGPGAKAQWDPPLDTSDVAEYWLYLYAAPGGYDLVQPPTAKVAVGTNEWVMSAGAPPDNTYYAVVTAADAAGNQSGPSNEVGPFRFDSVAPGSPPTNFRIVPRLVAVKQDGTMRFLADGEEPAQNETSMLIMIVEPVEE